ncbi:metalloendopeptidase OMA1, mitochondrial-like [Neltuma alba]|uniref:metalloendopeptidase OMA1, mitochondrial-like n=1 Tax=Neltuma alba TaxID=207710 RepID=UPI0010A2F086|nr:metalloendopeptidase OMA1, mitochondrial-like [Prosopis alba]XP_028797463.1 metalloendopeptidase OMA1, mitochondrial-like [Prosopis alba]XP_028797464.1 metalloendopeptidase OMA1, mitochondrial-like [Prosopis alba]
MGSHGKRSGKLVFDSFRSCSWRIMPKTEILLSNRRFSQFEHLMVPAWNRAKLHIGISSHSPISQRLRLQGRVNRNLGNPFLNEARRFYSVNQYDNVKQRRKSRGLRWWFRFSVLTVTCCSCVIVKTFYDHLHVVPYYNRTRLILFSESALRRLTEMQFMEKKKSFEGKILPDTHLETIRVRRIARDIIGACEEEIQRQGSQLSTTSHLDGLDWEVLVVTGYGHSFATVCGKIVLFDWMLEHVTSDAEIAFLIGREIGHIVAQHYAENLTISYCIKILKAILNPIGLWHAVRNKYGPPVIHILLAQEFEADYIGIRLSASAGYDPREAPKFLEKIDQFWVANIDKFWVANIVSPTPERRAEYLSSRKNMWQPLSIYLRGCLKQDK